MPLVLPHFTVEVHCIVCILRKLFNAWDNEKDHGVTTFPSDVRTAFSGILNDHNLLGEGLFLLHFICLLLLFLSGASAKEYVIHHFLGANHQTDTVMIKVPMMYFVWSIGDSDCN